MGLRQAFVRKYLRPLSIVPEFELAAACCRWPPSPAREKAIRAAARGPLDGARLLKVARRHRVQGLVHQGLADSGTALSEEAAAALKSEADRIAQANLQMAA